MTSYEQTTVLVAGSDMYGQSPGQASEKMKSQFVLSFTPMLLPEPYNSSINSLFDDPLVADCQKHDHTDDRTDDHTDGDKQLGGDDTQEGVQPPPHRHRLDRVQFGSRHITDHQIVQVSCGGNFTLFLMRNGRVFGIGDSKNHNYGNPDTSSQQLFELRSMQHRNIVHVACGFNFSYMLDRDGQLYCCGSNSYGQLSYPALFSTMAQRASEQHIPGWIDRPIDQAYFGGSPVVQVSCGGNFTCVLTRSNKLYYCGQCGQEYIQEFTLVQHDAFQKQTIRKVTCGGYHTLVLLDNGALYGLNTNMFGSSGTGGRGINNFAHVAPPCPSGVRDVVSGYNYFMCIGNDGRLYGSSGNDHSVKPGDGQLGSSVPCAYNCQYVVVLDLPYPVVEIVTGASSTTTFVVLENGDIYGAGCNEGGGLGLGDKENRLRFVRVLDHRDRRLPGVAIGAGAFHSVLCFHDTVRDGDWRQNLYCMVSGTGRGVVRDGAKQLSDVQIVCLS